jgi:hypothetical protein
MLKNGDWLHRPKPLSVASKPQPPKARGRCCLSPFFNKADAGMGLAEPRPEEAVLTFWPRTYLIRTLISQIVISNLALLTLTGSVKC